MINRIRGSGRGRAFAKRYVINQKTVAKWKKRLGQQTR